MHITESTQSFQLWPHILYDPTLHVALVPETDTSWEGLHRVELYDIRGERRGWMRRRLLAVGRLIQ